MSIPENYLPVASPREVRKALRVAAKPHRWQLVGVMLVVMAGVSAGLLVPYVLGRMVDDITDGADFGVILRSGIVLVAAGAASALLSYVGTRGMVGIIHQVLARLREELFDVTMSLPIATLEASDSADVVSRVTGDVESVAEAGTEVVPMFVTAVFTVALSLSGLFLLNPWLALAGLLSAPCYIIGTVRFIPRSRAVYGEVRFLEAQRGQMVLESVNGTETLLAFNEVEPAKQRVAQRSFDAIEKQVQGVKIRNEMTRWMHGGELVGLSSILIVGYLLFTQDIITVGMATAAALFFHRLFGPIGEIIFTIDLVQRAIVGLARLVGVLNLKDQTLDVPAASRQPTSEAPAAVSITVDDVTFAYQADRPGVKNVSLRIPAGQTVAFVGASGSGKSTVARLIAGFYEPTSGAIRVEADGATVSAAEATYLVSQETHLFQGTIADNLRMVAPEATDEQLLGALRHVGAEWALLDADVNDLTSGHAQHLALARVLLANPPVAIFDEATAELNSSNFDVIEGAIAAVSADRTTIVIAHQLDQVLRAERVVVFHEGSVAETGTHQELLNARGIYARLWAAYKQAQE